MTGVSIIIPTYNSSRTIGKCLCSINRQTKPCAEIIVVDRFSEDSTREMARQAGASVLEAEANRSEARNIGLKHASSIGILFIDSDMILPRDLVEECELKLLQHSAIVIPEISIGQGFWAQCKALERRINQGNPLTEAARCFRRDHLLAVGAYDSALEAGEDWDLQNRVKDNGFSIGRVDAIITHDEGNPSLVTLLRKKYAYGKAMGPYLKQNPNAFLRQLNPFLRVLRPSFRIIPSDPYHGSGVLMIKTLEFVAGGLGRIMAEVDDLR